MGLVQTIAPTIEPVSLAEAKLHLRVDITDDDLLIQSFITAAREYCEDYCRRQMVTSTWNYTLDIFPNFGSAFSTPDQVFGGTASYSVADQTIWIPKPPLQSVTSITYVDGSGVTQTLDPSLYQVDATTEPGRVNPAYGQVWPTTRLQPAAVSVLFVCGYSVTNGVSNAPESFKSAMKLLISNMYEQRDIVTESRLADLPTIDYLLWRNRVLVIR